MKAALAVNQRAHARGADLRARQPEFGEQRGHLGAAGNEGFCPDVDRLTTELLGAQHAAEPVGGFEHGDVRVVTERVAQSIGADEPRDAAADNAIGPAHSECTSATTSVMTPGSVPGSTP